MSSDGRRLAVVKGHHTEDVFVAKWSEDGTMLGTPQNLTQSDTYEHPNGWFSDSRAILFTSYRTGRAQISRLQLDSHTSTPIVPGPDAQFDPVTTPDGHWIFYWSAPHTPGVKATTLRLMKVHVTGGTPEQVSQFPPDKTTYLRCPSHPNSSCVLSQWDHNELVFYAFDAASGKGSALAETHLEAPQSLVWSISPDGSRVAVMSSDRLKNRIPILDLRKGIESSVSLPNGWFTGLDIGWTPDNKGLLIPGAQDGCFLARAGLDGKSTVLLRGGFNQCYSNPTASPDGRNLAFAQGVFNDNAWLLENF